MRLLCYSLFLLVVSSSPLLAQSGTCTDGTAQLDDSSDVFACDDVDLLGRLSLADLGGTTTANDIWGWTDPETGREYAIMGIFEGLAFVDVTDPEDPIYVARLDDGVVDDFRGFWRDVKVYQNHAYAVSEVTQHTVLIFDLTQLRDIASPPQLFPATARYSGARSSHNIAINEETGFAYVLGSDSGTESSCDGGLHFLNLSEPAAPTFAGCFAEAGYTHDAQCVVYDGPDTEHAGQEICFAFNEDRVVVVDVTDKAAPVQLSEVIYPNTDYTHQGWLTEDHRFLIGNDEGDENEFGLNTRTLVFDVQDLDDPEFYDFFLHDTQSTDHNLYVKDNWVFQANYSSGFRLLDATSLLNGGAGPGLESVAYFDTYPDNDGSPLDGAWSVYPFFESGNVVVSDMVYGLFVLRPQVPGLVDAEAPSSVPSDGIALSAGYPNPFVSQTRFDLRLGSAQAVRVEAYDVLGRRVALLFDGVVAANERRAVTLDGADLPAGTYLVRVTGEDFAETRHVTLAR